MHVAASISRQIRRNSMKELARRRVVIAAVGLMAASAGLRLSFGQKTRGPAVQYMEGTAQTKQRAFSPAVVTEGGKTVWLAGQTATEDLNHKSIVGDFDGQVRTVFALLDQILKRAGGSLRNMVTMTVFINDPRLGDRFIELRRGMFPDGKYPASALITVSNFARPGILIEIQGVAVIEEK
jgi:2-iminobutanoate/2-iminopropanoate deaminase